jgi:hypothetical protein
MRRISFMVRQIYPWRPLMVTVQRDLILGGLKLSSTAHRGPAILTNSATVTARGDQHR